MKNRPQSGKRNDDYPEKSKGSKIAKTIRRDANSLSETERESLFKQGMQIIYGGNGTKEAVRSGC